MRPHTDDNGNGTGRAPLARVYLASRFARREELRAIAKELENEGFVVTSRWLDSPTSLAGSDLDPGGRGAELALMDLEDLRRSDICVAFTEEAEHPRPGRGGRHTELGIAIALGIEVVLVGPREHVFHTLPIIRQFSDWPSACRALVPSRESGSSLVAG